LYVSCSQKEIEKKENDRRNSNSPQAYPLELPEKPAKRRGKQRVPVRDAVKESHGIEIRIDLLTAPFNKTSKPVLPSVMQLLLNAPGNNYICLDVPLVQAFYELRPVDRQDFPGIR